MDVNIGNGRSNGLRSHYFSAKRNPPVRRIALAAIVQRGFTYFLLLVLIAIMGIGMAAIGTLSRTERKREKEAQLLFVGDQYRRAIARYSTAAGGLNRRYPMTLTTLLKDEGQLAITRYLRKLYRDPITGGNDWGLIKRADGGIVGVYSKSEEEPLKIANFRKVDQNFESQKMYSDWKFTVADLGSSSNAPPATPKSPL